MLNPLIIGFVVFLLLLAGAFIGWMARQRLLAHHLTEDTKNLVSVSMAVVATVSALVLTADLERQQLFRCARG
jgi:divalent metal cation (Fe/Co/Zn/Cd) transporter